jgi:hypothetical protein
LMGILWYGMVRLELSHLNVTAANSIWTVHSATYGD